MKKSKARLAKILIATSLLIVVIMSVSYAWMYSNNTVQVKDLTVATVSANDLEFSIDGSNWKAEYTNIDLGDIEFEPVLGNGKEFFTYTIERQLVDSGEGYEMYGDVITGNEQIEKEDYGNYFLYQEFDVKSDHDVHLYLTSNTKISPLDTTKRINGNNVSRDYIAGAMRLAIYTRLTDSVEWEAKFFWIPNTTYELASDKSFTDNGGIESYFRYTNGLNDYTDITPDENSNTKEVDGVTYFFGDISDNTYICDIPGGYSEILISVWLEETDRESDNSLSGGLLNIYLAFDSTVVEEEE